MWRVVESDPVNGDGLVWATTLIQTLKLVRGESPFYGNYGIPAQQSVIQQIFPDYYTTETQRQYARHFAALIVSSNPKPGTRSEGRAPRYNVDVTLFQGSRLTGAAIPG